MHLYEIRQRKDKRGVDLISDALPFGRLWYGEPNAIGNAIGYAKHYSRSQSEQGQREQQKCCTLIRYGNVSRCHS